MIQDMTVRAIVDRDRWLTLDPPPARTPAPITETTPTRGRRLVLLTPDGYVYDHRAVTDPVPGPVPGQPVTDERLWVAIATEAEWFRYDEPLASWWPVTDLGGTPLVYVE